MTSRPPTTKSLRRRLFSSHLTVMFVALVVLAVVIGIVALVGEGKAVTGGRRDDGPVGLLLGLTAAATAAAIVSWRVTKRLASPLEEIGAATRELAAGNYNVRLPSAGTTELNRLADDVNQLAYELETTEQRRLRLIGDVAHELRNPLSTIQGTMEALLDGVVSPGEDTFDRVGREAARLRRLADDLSSLSLAGELGVAGNGEVDIDAIITDVVAQLEPQATAKGLTLTSQERVGPSQPVRGDQDRLTQVLMNVMGNAIQYSDQGHIVVSHSIDGATVVIEVTDSGRGLALEDQTRIFERFHRVDEHFTDGTGVGLAIARMIVDAHGGSIRAVSRGLGLGTTVRVELPTADVKPRLD